jgi:beta-1,4-N-acetylglucosaminyltransferase
MAFFIIAGAGLVVLFILRTATLLFSIRKSRGQQDHGLWRYKHHHIQHDDKTDTRSNVKTPQTTLVVLGSGGHTTEMLHLIQHLDPKRYQISLVVTATDTTSLRRVQAYPHLLPFDPTAVATYRIPRSREVGQSYLTSIATTIYSFWFAMWLVGRVRPDLVLVNGPGACVPVAMSVFFFRLIGWKTNAKIVFIESFCRVTSLSLTGKLLYHIADLFCVCWEELQEQLPLTQLVTTFVLPTSKVTEGSSKGQ